jgi:hypothetical protein
MPPKQSAFEFPEGLNSAPPTEPPRKVKVPRESTSLCAYCGARMAAALLNTTPPLGDNRWTAAAPYHTPSCRWVLTQGLRREKGGQE